MKPPRAATTKAQRASYGRNQRMRNKVSVGIDLYYRGHKPVLLRFFFPEALWILPLPQQTQEQPYRATGNGPLWLGEEGLPKCSCLPVTPCRLSHLESGAMDRAQRARGPRDPASRRDSARPWVWLYRPLPGLGLSLPTCTMVLGKEEVGPDLLLTFRATT